MAAVHLEFQAMADMSAKPPQRAAQDWARRPLCATSPSMQYQAP